MTNVPKTLIAATVLAAACGNGPSTSMPARQPLPGGSYETKSAKPHRIVCNDNPLHNRYPARNAPATVHNPHPNLDNLGKSSDLRYNHSHSFSDCASMGESVRDMTLPAGKHLFDTTADDLQAWCISAGLEPYRAKQILEWAYQKGAASFEAMTNLPRSLRQQLAAELDICTAQVDRCSEAADGTVKHLLRWPDGGTSECVMIPDGDRRTACISTQVGCPVRCVFCASGLDGLQRNLTAGQIVEQAVRVRSVCGTHRLSNVVFMGIGEPLANYDATMQAVRTINAGWGLNIGARRIAVSTVGLPSRIRQLADEGIQITLAISLHAPTDELRRELIPWAEGVKIAELVDAANFYFRRTGREVTLEYILLAGVNDNAQQARELARLAKKMRSNVNLIRYNPVAGLPFHRPDAQQTRAFQQALRAAGVNAHLRKSRGLAIEAACGQLRRAAEKHLSGSNEKRNDA